MDDDSNFCTAMEHTNEANPCGECLTGESLLDLTWASLEDDSAKPLEPALQKPGVVVSERRRLQNRQAQKTYSQSFYSFIGKQYRRHLLTPGFDV